jgi:acetyltransferase-like isoleucine patch superfamily enzyme
MRRPFPKFLNAILSFYSLAIYLQVVGICMLACPVLLKLGLIILVLYLEAPMIWRILSALYGPVPKVSFIGKKADTGNLWFAGHKLQELYETFDFLEKALKTIPGVYSAWLRLWGANIGKKVNWTSGCKLVDRPHIHIGDRSLIGNMSYISAHAIKKKDGKYTLFVKDVHVQHDVVLAYLVTLAPGVSIETGAFIESGSVVYPNQVIKEGQKYERFEELLNDRFKFLFERD